jgi:hypothetical protein
MLTLSVKIAGWLAGYGLVVSWLILNLASALRQARREMDRQRRSSRNG